MINSENIFGLFDEGKEKKDKNNVFDFKKHPAYDILMFKKLIQNIERQTNNVKIILDYISQDDVNNHEDISATLTEKIIYYNAWNHIKKVDIENELVCDSILENFSPELSECINLAILYFENIEEYEKCAFLKKIDTFIQKNVANPNSFC